MYLGWPAGCTDDAILGAASARFDGSDARCAVKNFETRKSTIIITVTVRIDFETSYESIKMIA